MKKITIKDNPSNEEEELMQKLCSNFLEEIRKTYPNIKDIAVSINLPDESLDENTMKIVNFANGSAKNLLRMLKTLKHFINIRTENTLPDMLKTLLKLKALMNSMKK
jgi:hypothetical protein